MWSEYELTYSRAEELWKEELTSIPEMKRSIDELKDGDPRPWECQCQRDRGLQGDIRTATNL